MCAVHVPCHILIRPNLEMKTRHKQLNITNIKSCWLGRMGLGGSISGNLSYICVRAYATGENLKVVWSILVYFMMSAWDALSNSDFALNLQVY